MDEINPFGMSKTNTESSVIGLREFLTKCKVVTLYEMKKNPMVSYTQLNKLEQKEFKRLVTLLYETNDTDLVTSKFNEIVCGVILDEKVDPSIYGISEPTAGDA